jgi:hypothetical protein
VLEIDLLLELPVPAAVAFAYVTAPNRLAEWQTNTVSVVADPPAPLRLGTRLTESRRAPVGGRQVTAVVEVVGYELGERFDLRVVHGPLPIDVDHVFVPGATAGTSHLEVRIHGTLPYPFRFVQPLFKRTLRKQFEADYGRLVERLEMLGRRDA